MKHHSSAQRAFRARLAEHFEFFLTTAGVLLALMVTLSELSRGDQGSALIFLIWLQGFLTWAVHRHCWFRRRALVLKMRAMLQDRVNSHLTVILGVAHFRARDATESDRHELETAVAAARAVSLELESLSIESLETRGNAATPRPPGQADPRVITPRRYRFLRSSDAHDNKLTASSVLPDYGPARSRRGAHYLGLLRRRARCRSPRGLRAGATPTPGEVARTDRAPRSRGGPGQDGRSGIEARGRRSQARRVSERLSGSRTTTARIPEQPRVCVCRDTAPGARHSSESPSAPPPQRNGL